MCGSFLPCDGIDQALFTRRQRLLGSPPTLNQLDHNYDLLIDTVGSLQKSVANHVADVPRVRNELAPIHRLPPEILGHILYLSLGKNSHQFLKQAHLRSTVCHLWREIANNAPSLWTTIGSGAKRSSVLKALTRFEAAPLDILYSDANSYPQFAADILPHLNRYRSLELILRSGMQVSNFIPTLAPQLKRLEIEVTVPSPQSGPVIDLSPTILPQMRHLTINGIDADLGACSSLHRLSITDGPETGPTMQNIMALLRNNTELQVLLLATPLPYQGDIHPIHLPLLQRLILSQASEHAQNRIISSIKVPSLNQFMALRPTLSAALLQPLLQQGIEVIRSLEGTKGCVFISGGGIEGWSGFIFSRGPNMASPVGEDAIVYLEDYEDFEGHTDYKVFIYLQPPFHTPALQVIADDLLKNLHDAEIVLTLDDDDDTPENRWRSLLSTFPQITQLSLESERHDTQRQFIQYLSARGQDGIDGWPCPLLKTLRIHAPDQSLHNDILQMVQNRYQRRSSRHQAAGDRPRPLEKLEVWVLAEDEEDKAWGKIEKIFAADIRQQEGYHSQLHVEVMELE